MLNIKLQEELGDESQCTLPELKHHVVHLPHPATEKPDETT